MPRLMSRREAEGAEALVARTEAFVQLRQFPGGQCAQLRHGSGTARREVVHEGEHLGTDRLLGPIPGGGKRMAVRSSPSQACSGSQTPARARAIGALRPQMRQAGTEVLLVARLPALRLVEEDDLRRQERYPVRRAKPQPRERQPHAGVAAVEPVRPGGLVQKHLDVRGLAARPAGVQLMDRQRQPLSGGPGA